MQSLFVHLQVGTFRKVSQLPHFFEWSRPQYRPPPIRSRINPERFILKAIAYHISSNKGREITTEKLTSRGLSSKKYGTSVSLLQRTERKIWKVLHFHENFAWFPNQSPILAVKHGDQVNGLGGGYITGCCLCDAKSSSGVEYRIPATGLSWDDGEIEETASGGVSWAVVSSRDALGSTKPEIREFQFAIKGGFGKFLQWRLLRKH